MVKAVKMASIVGQIVPLETMATGEDAVIVDISGRPDHVVRLVEMGLRNGCPIRMIRPGSPCIIEIDHLRLSLRLEETASILVDVVQ